MADWFTLLAAGQWAAGSTPTPSHSFFFSFFFKLNVSRNINGRRVVCHDDRYILRTAELKDGVVVSNDEYRDLTKENPAWRKIVEERLLMFTFVEDK